MRRVVGLAVAAGGSTRARDPWRHRRGRRRARQQRPARRDRARPQHRARRRRACCGSARASAAGASVPAAAYAFDLSDLTRIVANSDLAVENVTVLAGERALAASARRPPGGGGLRRQRDRRVAAVRRSSARARFATSAPMRCSRCAVATIERLTLGVWRARLRPTSPTTTLDCAGPAASARLDFDAVADADARRRASSSRPRSAFEARDVRRQPRSTKACAPRASPIRPASSRPSSSAAIAISALGVELTWVGHQVAAIGYQITRDRLEQLRPVARSPSRDARRARRSCRATSTARCSRSCRSTSISTGSSSSATCSSRSSRTSRTRTAARCSCASPASCHRSGRSKGARRSGATSEATRWSSRFTESSSRSASCTRASYSRFSPNLSGLIAGADPP